MNQFRCSVRRSPHQAPDTEWGALEYPDGRPPCVWNAAAERRHADVGESPSIPSDLAHSISYLMFVHLLPHGIRSRDRSPGNARHLRQATAARADLALRNAMSLWAAGAGT
jgi:hypothetical protein